MGKRTGVTGYIVTGSSAMSAHIAQDASGAFVAQDAAGVELSSFDPSDFGEVWITQRAITSAMIASGVKGSARVVDLPSIKAALLKDRRAARYTTAEFVAKMDPRRAGQIIAGLNARYTVATETKKTA